LVSESLLKNLPHEIAAVLFPISPLNHKKVAIYSYVYEYYTKRKDDLEFSCQVCRVNDRLNIMNNKVTCVNRLPCLYPEIIFNRGERADTPGHFDNNPPDDARDVKPDKLGPENNKDAAQDDKKNEGKMENHHAIGENLVDYCAGHTLKIGRQRFVFNGFWIKYQKIYSTYKDMDFPR
jgi:hypothetical protein